MGSPEAWPSELTFDEFAMGFHANLQAAADSADYNDPEAAWDKKRSIESMIAMSDADPDFHTALTDANPHSQQARHKDIHCQVIVASTGFSGLPEGPPPEEFERLLFASSLGNLIRSNRWY